MNSRKYPVTYPLDEVDRNRSQRVWFPKNPTIEGYSLTEINRLEVVREGQAEPVVRPAHGRLALADGPETVEPLLHVLDLPYDEFYAEAGKPTQLSELARLQQEFGIAHPELDLQAINLAGFAMLALQRRIEAKPMPAASGFMCMPGLGRKTVDGVSLVGGMYSSYGQLKLGDTNGRHSHGDSRSGIGIGLSVGQKAELQAA